MLYQLLYQPLLICVIPCPFVGLLKISQSYIRGHASKTSFYPPPLNPFQKFRSPTATWIVVSETVGLGRMGEVEPQDVP